MADGRFLGAGGHPERPEEAVDQDVELVDVPAITQKGHGNELDGWADGWMSDAWMGGRIQ